MDWAWLPDGILDLVLSNLSNLQDYIRFGCVCKSWNSVTEHQRRRRRIPDNDKQVPLLLVPSKNRSREWRSLYNVTRDKFLDTKLRIPYHRRCCGSSHGWLAFLEKDYCVTLYNPFTRVEISLPPVGDTSGIRINRRDHAKFFPIFAKKVILSADPSLYPDDYVVAALINEGYRTLALIRPGRDNGWTHFTKWSNYTEIQGLTYDIIFDKSGKWVYGSGHGGMLARASVDPAVEPILDMVVPPWDYFCVWVQKYLVETTTDGGGDILMILRFFEEQEGYELSMETKDIKVFKLQDSKFVEVEDLNGDAVFIGDNASTAISAANFEGIEANCIYYTDDFVENIVHYYRFGPHDVGKFNVKEKTFSTHYIPSRVQNRNMPPPIWIFPTLNPLSSRVRN
ncbi:Probable F-box protein At4g22165 [Linum grandiflorum]